MLIASRLNSAQPALGQGYELDAIAAVVIGGTSPTGDLDVRYNSFGHVGVRRNPLRALVTDNTVTEMFFGGGAPRHRTGF